MRIVLSPIVLIAVLVVACSGDPASSESPAPSLSPDPSLDVYVCVALENVGSLLEYTYRGLDAPLPITVEGVADNVDFAATALEEAGRSDEASSLTPLSEVIRDLEAAVDESITPDYTLSEAPELVERVDAAVERTRQHLPALERLATNCP